MTGAPDKTVKFTETIFVPVAEPTETPPKWAWRSHGVVDTDETISVLACVETVVCSGLWLLMIVELGWVLPAVWVCLSPLVLLRTQASTQRGVRIGLAVARSLGPDRAKMYSMTEMALRQILPPLTSPFTKIIATVSELVLSPMQSISAVPRNWRISCFHRDACSRYIAIPADAPTWVPTAYDAVSAWKLFLGLWAASGKIRQNIGAAAYWRSRAGMWCVLLSQLVATVLLIAIGAYYRFSVKASALGYWALSLIITRSRTATPSELIADIRKSASRFSRLPIATVCVFLLATRLLANEVIEWLRAIDEPAFVHRLVHAFLGEPSIPVWQIVAGLNGLVIIGMFIRADRLMKRRDEGLAVEVWGLAAVARVSAWAAWYTAICTGIVILRLVIKINPTVGPWLPDMW